MQDTQYTSWDRKGPIAKQLVEQINLHQRTKGAYGIDPSITKPALIRSQILDKNPFLQTLNPSYFPKNFRDIVNNWKVNMSQERQRKGKLLLMCRFPFFFPLLSQTHLSFFVSS